MFQPTHVAVIGSDEYPVRIEVRFVKDHDMAPFKICEDASGQRRHFHRLKLKEIEPTRMVRTTSTASQNQKYGDAVERVLTKLE
jgi:hypothetical protein